MTVGGLKTKRSSANDGVSQKEVIDFDGFMVGSRGIIFTPAEMFGLSTHAMDGLYGKKLQSEDGDDDGDDAEECLICLTDQKEILLLPCKHFCVCSECFVHLDKCPVCRAGFDKYVLVDKEAAEIIHVPKAPLKKYGS